MSIWRPSDTNLGKELDQFIYFVQTEKPEMYAVAKQLVIEQVRTLNDQGMGQGTIALAAALMLRYSIDVALDRMEKVR